MIQVNRIYLIFNRLVTKKFLVDTSVIVYKINLFKVLDICNAVVGFTIYFCNSYI